MALQVGFRSRELYRTGQRFSCVIKAAATLSALFGCFPPRDLPKRQPSSPAKHSPKQARKVILLRSIYHSAVPRVRRGTNTPYQKALHQAPSAKPPSSPEGIRITPPMTERGQVNFPSGGGRSPASVDRIVRALLSPQRNPPTVATIQSNPFSCLALPFANQFAL
jgi:hypothetical protein